MNLTLIARRAACACTVLCLMTSTSLLHAQSEDERPSGAQMMEELVRLTMVPLADTPLEFEGNMAYELTQNGQTRIGELRWGDDGKRLMWTDALDRKGLYTVQLDPARPLASLTMMNEEGSFLTPDMMKMARYWTEEGIPHPATRTLKRNNKASPDTLLGRPCVRHDAKLGKARASVWVATEDLNLSDAQLAGLRATWSHWLNARAGADELHGLLLPDGLPLKVEWGLPNKDKSLPNAITAVTLNAATSYTLNAPEIWMLVPGRDINEVARELRDQREAGEKKNTDAAKE